MKSRSHRLPTISDTPDDWVDESWTVDCVCGVNFDDGEEMVDCDECGVWVHTRCSRYVKSEKLFACDKCKSKKLRKESEETEVAQLLVELPTKTLRMDKPYPLNCTNQNPFHVWTEVPMEEKVHVQGIPGGDPALFSGVSSIFNSNLWKCTGYVPKKFNYQYREFPCWDNRQDNDNNNDNKIKEEVENHDNNGADALFLLSKENVVIKTEVSVGEGTLDMGPPNTDLKKHEVENHEIRRQQSGIKKERSLVKTIVFHSGNQKKDESNRKKNAKFMEKDGESKKINHHSSDSVATTSSDAKQSESNKGVKVFKTNKQSGKHENSRTDVQNNHKSEDYYDKNNSQPSGDDSRTNASKEAKQQENDGDQVISTDQISPEKEDDMASSSLIQNPMETRPMKHEAEQDVDDNARSKSNETKSNKNSLEKVDNHAPIEVKSVEINDPEKISNSQNDTKLDSPKTVTQDPNIPDNPESASVEMKKEAVYVSQKAQKLNKSPLETDTKPDEPDKCGPTQPKLYVKRSETSTVARSSEAQNIPSQRKIIVKKPSVPDKSRYSNTDDHKSSGKNNIKIKKDNNNNNNNNNNNGDVSDKSKKPVKDLHKSSSTSALKSSHLSKSSHVLKKNSSDLKDSAILSSSKTSSAALESGDSANSSRSENRAHGQNKINSEKTSQLNRQHAPKNHPPHVHPTPSTNAPATLSDEELALLLHQELNSSPRVPRVPRMRHAGSLPQLASGTSLMKRTSSSVVKDNTVLASRKKNKDLAKKSEFEGLKRCVSVSYSRRINENSKVKRVVDKPTVSTSGPSSSNEATPQIASDDETGKSTHRTLPGLIAEIMSKGKRMTYEELCNAVLPHWPNLRKHNGERYAYSSHSQAVLDCLRNRSEWSRLVDRGPKTNGGRKRRKSESDGPNLESEEDDYSTDRNTKENEFPKGKRKHRRLALQGRGIKDVRRRRKAEVVSDEDEDDDDSSSSDSDSSEESAFSDEEMQERKTSGQNEASASSDEMGTS